MVKGMSEKLPTGNFRWLSKEEVDMFNVHNIDAEGGTCYILDVNLQYPKAIHDLRIVKFAKNAVFSVPGVKLIL